MLHPQFTLPTNGGPGLPRPDSQVSLTFGTRVRGSIGDSGGARTRYLVRDRHADQPVFPRSHIPSRQKPASTGSS